MTTIRRALLTWPDQAAWRSVATELAWGLPLIALLSWAGGLVTFDPVEDPRSIFVPLAILFVAPALGEEILFRGALLDPAKPRLTRLIVAVALFVLWHPLQAVTIGPPWAGLFLNPWFLAAAAALGVLLCRVYVRTASLWPCILIHWFVVAAWKFAFGGPF